MRDRLKRGSWLTLVAGLVMVLLPLSTGCMRGCTSTRSPIHINPNMDYQEKLQPQEASQFFYDGIGMRQPVAGTVARGELRESSEVYVGKTDDGQYVTGIPIPVDQDVLARGEDRFNIYCAPCHTERGDGRGILHDNGTPTTSIHIDRVLALSDGEMFEVISEGRGLMQGYKYPISTQDRWAIVAWVNKLQQDEIERQAEQ